MDMISTAHLPCGKNYVMNSPFLEFIPSTAPVVADSENVFHP